MFQEKDKKVAKKFIVLIFLMPFILHSNICTFEKE